MTPSAGIWLVHVINADHIHFTISLSFAAQPLIISRGNLIDSDCKLAVDFLGYLGDVQNSFDDVIIVFTEPYTYNLVNCNYMSCGNIIHPIHIISLTTT